MREKTAREKEIMNEVYLFDRNKYIPEIGRRGLWDLNLL